MTSYYLGLKQSHDWGERLITQSREWEVEAQAS